MWHALRTEIAYFNVWLLGGLGIATGIVTLISVLMRLDPDEGPPAFVVFMFPLIAGMVVSFVAQGYRVEEHRARLLLAGPLTPRYLAAITVLLPSCFAGICAAAGLPLMALGALIAGGFAPSSPQMVAGFAMQFLAYAQLGPLAQEASAARRQGRNRASLAGWAAFSAAILFLAACQFFVQTAYARLGIIATILATMAVAARLYVRRTDFTR